MESNNGDMLNLSKQVSLSSQFADKEKIVFSCEIMKFNDANKCQQRVFVVTNNAVYNVRRSENFIGSMMSKLVNLSKKFVIKRRIWLKAIEGITLSCQQGNSECVLHVSGDYDYRLKIDDLQMKKNFLKAVSLQYEKVSQKKMKFFFKDDVTLIKHCTLKSDLKNNTSRVPKDSPIYLNIQDLTDYEAPGSKFELLYSERGVKLEIAKFVSSNIEKMVKNRQYFSIQSKTAKFENIKIFFQNKHPFVVLPHYIYKANEHLYLLRPLMIGGKMDKLMNSLDFLKKEVCVFYISQLILVLEFLHSKGWVYRAASLSKIYMKENGYIAVEGVSKLMRRKTKDDELFFDICGLPYDFAPEMILCEGHNQKIDMWGLGLCAYNMLEGRHPFASYNAHETFRNILEKKVGQSQSLPNFVVQCLEKDPIDRPTLQQVKTDSFFAGIDWQMIEKEQIPSPYIPQLNSAFSWEGKLPSIVYLQNNK